MDEPARIAFTVRVSTDTNALLRERLAVVQMSRSEWVEAVIRWALTQPVGKQSIVQKL